ncbi:RWD domain-containing protein 2A [Nylanderia fulva]|uniref:RWD domain-containing protein 2A n=1 Tax=Nylanderia fulva TaxID=613905 RepID=UPI0010FB6698|nr:RWD domain-containing protein 2A [Nylanderia fulva]
MSTSEEVTENLTAQMNELQALQSVYPNELVVADYGVLADINEYIVCPNRESPRWLEYAIAIPLNGENIELLVNLPTNYPQEQPDIYARSSRLDRTQQCLLNKKLSIIIKAQEPGEPCIYTLISWLQDNAETYFKASVCNQSVKCNDTSKTNAEETQTAVIFSRYWIYSHHIYSKFKRRDVANLAKENSITGFCLAGKPGIICMEGSLEDCDYCWQKIKTMNWHRILIKLLEKEEDCNVDSMRRFTDFQEVSFPTTERHNNMGQLLKYLTDHNCQHAFKELFGIEGKFSKFSD